MDWYEAYDLPRRKRLEDYLWQLSEQQDWNRERFSVFDGPRLDAVKRVFREEDDAFAARFFPAPWAEVFPLERVAETANERSRDALTAQERLAVDSVVSQGMDRAREIYLDQHRDPSPN